MTKRASSSAETGLGATSGVRVRVDLGPGTTSDVRARVDLGPGIAGRIRGGGDIRRAVGIAALAALAACNVPIERFARPDAGPEGDDAAVCSAPRTQCGDDCVVLAESSSHCGQCERDCGGGECRGGACQPVVIAGANPPLDQPARLAVNASAVFWTEPTRVRSCPLPAGCTGAPAVIADNYTGLDALAASDDAVYFAGCPGCTDHRELTHCPVTGCPSPVPDPVSTTSKLLDIVVAKNHIFWREEPATLGSCLPGDCAATVFRFTVSPGGLGLTALVLAGDTLYLKPGGTSNGAELRTCSDMNGCGGLPIITASQQVTIPFRIRDNKAYWATGNLTNTQISRCSLTNCSAGTQLAIDDPGGAELAIDASSAYWLTSTGAVRSCPLAGCPPAGPTTLATGRTGAKQLTLGLGFLYWIEGDTIVRLARF